MNKFGWLAVTLVGTAISVYGNSQVQKLVREENAAKMLSGIKLVTPSNEGKVEEVAS